MPPVLELDHVVVVHPDPDANRAAFHVLTQHLARGSDPEGWPVEWMAGEAALRDAGLGSGESLRALVRRAL